MGARSVGIAVAAVCVVAASPALAECKLNKLAELPIVMDGLIPVVQAKINGTDVRMIEDTGAFYSMLSYERIERLGLKLEVRGTYGRVITGVNGESWAARTMVEEFSVVGRTFNHVEFLVEGPRQGLEIDGLLGRNFLSASDEEIDLAGGAVRMYAPEGCGPEDLVFWPGPASYSIAPLVQSRDGAIETDAYVNGHKLRAVLDTGAPFSMITRAAAEAAGLRQADMVPAAAIGGLGRGVIKSWTAPVASFKLGSEEIHDTRLRIGDSPTHDYDMLVGADFFLSHHVYVAKSQNQIYFTYNGGPVFRSDTAPDTAGSPAATPADAGAGAPSPPAGAEASTGPTDADGLVRRGAARAARQEYELAVADFSRAIALQPKDGDAYLQRALARRRLHQDALALQDFDQAIALNPNDVRVLMERGSARLADGKDLDGARADFGAAVKLDSTLRRRVIEALEASAQFEPLIRLYDEWLAALPAKSDERPALLNNRCWARGLAGRELDKALDDCNAALHLEPYSASDLDSRGLIHLRLGQYDAAIGDFNFALAIRPKSPSTMYLRGLAKLKAGRKDQGEADLKRATTDDPGLPDYFKRFGLAPDAKPS